MNLEDPAVRTMMSLRIAMLLTHGDGSQNLLRHYPREAKNPTKVFEIVGDDIFYDADALRRVDPRRISGGITNPRYIELRDLLHTTVVEA